MVAYLTAAYVIRSIAPKKPGNDDNRFLLTRIFDSATFSGSLMLLLGIVDDDILKLLGSTKPFLLVSGLAGIIYSLHALNPRDEQD